MHRNKEQGWLKAKINFLLKELYIGGMTCLVGNLGSVPLWGYFPQNPFFQPRGAIWHGVQMSVRVPALSSFGFIPRSGIPGLHGNSVWFWRSAMLSHDSVTILHLSRIFTSVNLVIHTKIPILNNPNLSPHLLYAIASKESHKNNTNSFINSGLLEPVLPVFFIFPCFWLWIYVLFLALGFWLFNDMSWVAHGGLPLLLIPRCSASP